MGIRVDRFGIGGLRWLALRLDFLAVLVVSLTSLFVIVSKGHVEPAYAGLALSYAAQVSRNNYFNFIYLCTTS